MWVFTVEPRSLTGFRAHGYLTSNSYQLTCLWVTPTVGNSFGGTGGQDSGAFGLAADVPTHSCSCLFIAGLQANLLAVKST